MWRFMEDKAIKIFGETVRRERIKLRISVQELADKMEMKRSTVSAIELGTRNPRFSDIFKFAELFNVSPAYLLTGCKDENRKETLDKLQLSDCAISAILNMDQKKKKVLEEIITNDVVFDLFADEYGREAITSIEKLLRRKG